MLNTSLIRKIKAKHPEYSEDQIRLVIKSHLKILNSILVRAETFKVTINKFGTIHTHGNAIRKAKLVDRKYHKKNMRNVKNFSDKRLLF